MRQSVLSTSISAFRTPWSTRKRVNPRRSYTGLLCYLYEYPRRIQDWDFAPECHDDNKILRKHLVKCFVDQFPKASADCEAVSDGEDIE
jgi:hypothetical protein